VRHAAELRAELTRLRGAVMGFVGEGGLTIASAGSHPFSTWWEQDITPLERYEGVRRDMGDLAQRLLIFGMHVHVGIEDKEFAIDALNVARYFLPHLLALTTSSPFWIGRNTGLKSYRSTVFRGFPRTGIPTRLSGWAEYQEYLDTLTHVGSIPDGSKIWWDARPHHKYPTLEFRLCDACTRVEEAVCVAAIIQALVHKLWKMRLQNVTFRDYSSRLIDENKWRAMRFGLSGKLIDFGRQVEKPRPSSSASSSSGSSATPSTSSAPARRSSTPTASSTRGRAPTGSSPSTSARGASRPWSTRSSPRRPRASRSSRGRRCSRRWPRGRRPTLRAGRTWSGGRCRSSTGGRSRGSTRPPSIRIGDLDLAQAAPSLPSAGI
jgi:YbdK family carboxylate-amine ligase